MLACRSTFERAAGHQFNEKKVSEELARYRLKGPGPTTRWSVGALRRALKLDGRLVIVEPVTPSRRGRPRADEARSHEIDPEYVLQDARAAGFDVITRKDPFTRRDREIHWLMALQPGDIRAPSSATSEAKPEANEAIKPQSRGRRHSRRGHAGGFS